jgi:hypothetical protein
MLIVREPRRVRGRAAWGLHDRDLSPPRHGSMALEMTPAAIPCLFITPTRPPRRFRNMASQQGVDVERGLCQLRSSDGALGQLQLRELMYWLSSQVFMDPRRHRTPAAPQHGYHSNQTSVCRRRRPACMQRSQSFQLRNRGRVGVLERRVAADGATGVAVRTDAMHGLYMQALGRSRGDVRVT